MPVKAASEILGQNKLAFQKKRKWKLLASDYNLQEVFLALQMIDLINRRV